MKSKKRNHTSSEDSEDSDASENSSSSGSEDSSISERRYKKKRKRAESSESDSDSDDQKRSKKRKHKKKKKKHSKKKKRSDAVAGSDTAYDVFSLSDGEISSKKKRKHKHKHKRGRSSSVSEIAEDHVQRRLHSVVKERRDSSEERSQPTRTYYQKEYRRSVSHEDYEREREVQRFYRGSSKERRNQYQQQHEYNREHNDRYAQYHEKYDRNREKQGPVAPYNGSNEDFNRRQKEYNDYKRNQRYEDHRPPEQEYRRRPRDDVRYQPKEDPRGYNRYNQNFEDRGPKRREFEDNRDYRERRGPPDHDRVRDREYPDRKEKYHREEEFPADRGREFRREKPAGGAARPGAPAPAPASHLRNQSRSRSREDRFKERNHRPENREERYERDGRGDERRERAVRGERIERGERVERGVPPARAGGERPRADRPELHQRERKTRFTDTNESKEYNWGKTEVKKEDGADVGDKEKPDFGLSGKLTADVNTFNGVVIKYAEPEDAKQPKRRWRFYPFKGDKALPILYIHRQSAFLIGRDKKVVDIALEHPSISKQHAALQFRATPFTRDDGTQSRRVRPYVIDLDSANGTFVNNKKIEPRRYMELLERDVVKFGFSQREYVLLHENSKDDALDDDHEPLPPTADRVKRERRARQELAQDGE